MKQSLGKRAESKVARRACIVAEARDAFLDQGYAATSMSTIAALLGGSKGTLWSYFPSKESLFEAVLEDVTAVFRQQLEDALLPGRDQFTTLLDFAQRFLGKLMDPQASKLHRLIVGEGGRFPEIGRLFYERGPRPVMQRLAAYIEQQMEAGELRRDDPARVATDLMQLSQVPHHQRLWGIRSPMTPEEIRAHATRAVEVFLRAYRV